MQSTEILVSGAGIAGCAVAYLLRERGWAPTVVERAPGPRPGGQTVDLRGAARTVVEGMGLLDAVRARTLDQRGIAWVDARGRRRAEMPVEAFGGNGIISRDEILRGDLAAVLHGACTDVDFLFDDTVTALEEEPDGVLVHFEKAPSRRFALVVGADGVYSTVRRLAFGPHEELLRPLGLLNAWFTVPAETDLHGWYLMHNAPGGRVAALRPGRTPAQQQAGLSVRTGSIVDGLVGPGAAGPGARHDADAAHDMLARCFAGVGWEVPRLVRGARDAEDLYLHPTSQVHMTRWSRGRVVLLGDAAWCPSPLTGLGTSLALVGAHVLAGELARADHEGAFEAFEQVLRPYVAQAQELPPGGIDGYAPRTGARIRIGWAVMRWSTRWPLRPAMERVFAKGDAIALPDYPAPRRDEGGQNASAGATDGPDSVGPKTPAISS